MAASPPLVQNVETIELTRSNASNPNGFIGSFFVPRIIERTYKKVYFILKPSKPIPPGTFVEFLIQMPLADRIGSAIVIEQIYPPRKGIVKPIEINFVGHFNRHSQSFDVSLFSYAPYEGDATLLLIY